MFMEVKQKNPNWIEKLKLRYKQEPLEAAVGYPRGKDGVGNAHYEGGASLLEVAIYNNYGTEDIPRRAFMEEAAKNMQPKYKKMMKDAVKDINSGKITLKQVLKKAALMGQSEVQKAIMDGDWTPNAKKTILRKESKRPLMDKGDMRKYATSDVRARTK
jgi:hypothetical protein